MTEKLIWKHGHALGIPVVHKNGTSGEELLEQKREAMHALDEALVAVKAACPHRRDYYPLDNGVWEAARNAHFRRLAMLTEMRDELLDEALAIQDQLK